MKFEIKETKIEQETRLIQEDLDKAKIESVDKLKTKFNDIMNLGMGYKNLHIQMDSSSQSDFAGMVQRASIISYPTAWWAYENEYIKIETQEELESIADLLLLWKMKKHSEKCTTRQAIEKASSIEEIEQIINTYLGEE